MVLHLNHVSTCASSLEFGTFDDYDRASQSRFNAYFEILVKILRSAARPTVLENLRPLFKVFLEAFEVAASPANHVDVSINAQIHRFIIWHVLTH